MTKRYITLLYFVSALFVLLVVMLCWHSRLASDDYCYIANVRFSGIIKCFKEDYFGWCGRFSANYLLYVIFKVLDQNQTYYFLYPLFLFVLLVVGARYTISNLLNYYDLQLAPTKKWLLGLLFSALLFFTTIDIGETWFWYSSLSTYLCSAIAFILGLGFLFATRHYILTTLASSLCFVYVGGASEVYSFIYILFFSYLIYYNFIKYNYNMRHFFYNKQNRKLVLSFILFFISFIIVVMAPGNYARATLFPQPEFLNSIVLMTRMVGKLLFWFLPLKLIYIVAFAAPFIVIGNEFRTDDSLTSKKNLFQKIIITVALLIVLSIFVFSVIAIVMSQSGEYRVWFIISFLIAVFSCYIAFTYGYTQLISNKMLNKIKILSLIIAVSVVLFHLIDQYLITKKYSDAVDKRIDYLITINQHTKDTLIYVDPLPPSGMLYSSEISTDKNYFTNGELRLGLGLKYHLAVKKKE